MLKGLEPEALLRIAEAINSMWSSVVYRYATFLGMSLRKRLEIVLGELAERFGVPDSRGTLLLPELAQEELAEMIGSSRPMVSKLLTEMTDRGLLIREGRRHILIAAQKQGAAAASAPAHASPACIPRSNRRPPATRRVRADRRAVRVPAAPIVNI